MQYVKPYTYFVSKPGGTQNLLFGSLALLTTAVIPILGQIVVIGYMSETAEDLERDPEIAEHPNFDFNRLVEYLTRGIWPFLMQFLIGIAMLGLVMVVIAIAVVAAALANMLWVGIAVGSVLLLPVTFLGTMLAWPMTLHAQLRREFRFGEAARFTSQFIRRTGGQLFIALLVHFLISLPLTLVGLLLCIVGIYPAMMIGLMAQEHYMIQLYRIYLDEGGEPIGGPSEQLAIDEE